MLSDVIDLAGRQRMLNQRLGKEALLAKILGTPKVGHTLTALEVSAQVLAKGGVLEAKWTNGEDMEYPAPPNVEVKSCAETQLVLTEQLRALFGNWDELELKQSMELIEQFHQAAQATVGALVLIARQRDAEQLNHITSLVGLLQDSANESIDSLNTAVTELGGLMGQLQLEAEQLSGKTSSTTKDSEPVDYLTGAEKLNENFDGLERKICNTQSEIETLHDHESYITKRIHALNLLTASIRLLALNASIEAQHAGEAGASFSVVAKEVRGLAEQTKDATGAIEDTIGSLSETIRQATDQMGNTRKEVRGVSQLVKANSLAAIELRNSANKLNDFMRLISTCLQRVSHQVGLSISEVTKVSDNLRSVLLSEKK